MIKNYLDNVVKQFEYYKSIGDKALDQLSEKELFWRYNKESNSIAIIIKHLHGNMLSRWTNFLNSDGEKNNRDRDDEFEVTIKSKKDIVQDWNQGWQTLFDALAVLNENNFKQTVHIRNQKHSITEAINRQMMHYAYHIGQMVYVGKMIKGKAWKNLSIPIGRSKAYNEEIRAKLNHDELKPN